MPGRRPARQSAGGSGRVFGEGPGAPAVVARLAGRGGVPLAPDGWPIVAVGV